PQLLEIVHVAGGQGADAVRAAQAFYAVSERLGTARLREGVREAAGDDPWNRRYAQALGDDVTGAQRAVVAAVLRAGGEPAIALERLEVANAPALAAYREVLQELRAEGLPLAAFALAVRQLQGLARTVAGA
ncbi:MAG TPA: hypothetical protein VFR81_15495, partial [Longimicrobium sp.]|nr:hypothetical protein [Longimicrobium sp.]